MSPQPIRIWADSFKAAAIHLFLSFLLAGALATLLFKFWYPVPLAEATGVFTIFAIVFAVDLIIGPLLTLIVYKKNKKSLVFDLATIAIIQIAALSYGVYSLSQARPVWLTFYDNRFETVRLNDIEKSYLDNVPEQYTRFSLTGPKWVAAKPVGSLKEIENLKFGNKLGAKIAHQPALYYPIEQAYPETEAKAYDLIELEAANSKAEIDKYVSLNPKVAGWLPLWGQQQHMVVFVDEKGAPLNIVDLRPWTEEQMSTVLTSTL